jgi:signal transduction histidine kinase/CheY-like chemotaxis protein
MATNGSGSDVNLGVLRSQLTGRLALLLMGAGALLIVRFLPVHSFPLSGFIPPLVAMGLGWAVRRLNDVCPALARHLLAWSLAAGLLVTMWLFPAPWIPFLGLMPTFIGAMLVAGGGFVTGGAVAALAAWLVQGGSRAYPLPELLVALTLGMALAWLAVRTLYTALEWAWTMQQEAAHLLEVARDHQGELNRTLKSLDLTNAILLRTQRELVFARQQAEEAQRLKEQFAANVSHELRTPLNLILGFSEVMYLSPEVYGNVAWSPALRQDVYQIYRSSRHLLEMINDVLDLSRFEMVGFTLDKEPTPLEPLLQDTLEIVHDLFRELPVRLELEIEEGLPALEIDHTRIRQVLLNLLNNAARFTREGMVRVEARRADGEVVISIRDTGPGIPEEELVHIFEEFYQIDRSLSRKQGGAGLGLAICQRFVKAHEGRIWVESQVGKGSTFSFTLPIPGQTVPMLRPHAGREAEWSWPEARVPVLVVDPDPAVASLVRRHVRACEVVQVAEGNRLAEAVALHHPHAVVWNVPPGEQRDLHIPCLPVPFIACSLPSQAWLASERSVTACLTKPITAPALLGEIERLGNVRNVLVVDDDRGFCQLVERTLKASGRAFRVDQAYDGEDGLRAMRARPPDIVLLDLIMPGLDGFQVLEAMRREPRLVDIPVVLVTAVGLAEDALMRRSIQLTVHRPDGLRLVEVLCCLEALIGVLRPRYDERSMPEEIVGRET